jgi:hypothetical protein
MHHYKKPNIISKDQTKALRRKSLLRAPRRNSGMNFIDIVSFVLLYAFIGSTSSGLATTFLTATTGLKIGFFGLLNSHTPSILIGLPSVGFATGAKTC